MRDQTGESRVNAPPREAAEAGLRFDTAEMLSLLPPEIQTVPNSRNWAHTEGEEVFMTTNGSLHPGISMHKLPISGGAVGLLFAVGSMLVFLLGIPAMGWFLVGSGALGV